VASSAIYLVTRIIERIRKKIILLPKTYTIKLLKAKGNIKEKDRKKKNQAAYTLHTCMKNFCFQVTYLTLQFSSRKTHATNCMS
jgi:hypothetical protein